MDIKQVKSSNVAVVALTTDGKYERVTDSLFSQDAFEAEGIVVIFNNGGRYMYTLPPSVYEQHKEPDETEESFNKNVYEKVFQMIVSAESPTKQLNAILKPFYNCFRYYGGNWKCVNSFEPTYTVGEFYTYIEESLVSLSDV